MDRVDFLIAFWATTVAIFNRKGECDGKCNE
jgi:hypothetical protein